MQLIISNATNYNDKDKVFFSKAELQIILQTYSKQVSSGICRDYSIDHSKQKVTFSFFRSTFDKPLFQIQKKANFKSKLLFDFKFLLIIEFPAQKINTLFDWSIQLLIKPEISLNKKFFLLINCILFSKLFLKNEILEFK